ncbi:MAG: hypothetical protein KGZ80_09295 [Methylomonas sp.]|nr:hypothetical protein [Methylomonas sp.]PPD22789.1 MAG: hypothetical protein CTY23_00205 [Methylomonas sp.]PPD23904.1 MAG: hypothetical protein CTY22_11680 [Methylomonas sp.]PPD31958.1 MAG: hypothetical protein CTY21_11645 [Methylomonas sp.]PPD42773.1 MAG: hypothetical protein CTY17_00260 [Methylomonas sp.]
MNHPFFRIEYPVFKWAILGLLTLNAVIYALTDTVTRAVDALTWLILLVIYEMEAQADTLSLGKHRLAMTRSVLIGAIVLVFFSYFNASAWLDVTNALLWFALIAIMETEVRWPTVAMRHGNVVWLLTIGVFGGLVVVATFWVWQRQWLDAYDAMLWIIAFASIEADILQLLKRKQEA